MRAIRFYRYGPSDVLQLKDVDSTAAVIPTIILVSAWIWGFIIPMSSHTLSGSGARGERWRNQRYRH